MPILSQPAFGPKLAIGFITGGALIDVWALVWRYTIAPSTLTASQQFWYSGLLLTGLTFLVIGAFLGSIGRAARKAELPPTDETTRAEVAIQNQAAANPHPAVAGAAVVPGTIPAAPAPAVAAPAVAAPAPAPPAGTVIPRQA
jgi:hypothetical protein